MDAKKGRPVTRDTLNGSGTSSPDTPKDRKQSIVAKEKAVDTKKGGDKKKEKKPDTKDTKERKLGKKTTGKTEKTLVVKKKKKSCVEKTLNSWGIGFGNVTLRDPRAIEAAQALNLSPSHLRRLKIKFDLIDIDGSGNIDSDEFFEAVGEQRSPLTDRLFAMIDLYYQIIRIFSIFDSKS